jgi:hypothetical protein
LGDRRNKIRNNKEDPYRTRIYIAFGNEPRDLKWRNRRKKGNDKIRKPKKDEAISLPRNCHKDKKEQKEKKICQVFRKAHPNLRVEKSQDVGKQNEPEIGDDYNRNVDQRVA